MLRPEFHAGFIFVIVGSHFFGQDVVQLFEAVERGLGASVGQIIADGYVRFVRLVVLVLTVQVAMVIRWLGT